MLANHARELTWEQIEIDVNKNFFFLAHFDQQLINLVQKQEDNSTLFVNLRWHWEKK